MQGSEEFLFQGWEKEHRGEVTVPSQSSSKFEVREEGWVMNDLRMTKGTKTDRPLIRLPPELEVARLGVPDVSLSCMRLGLRGGVWQPFNPYCDKSCVANAYPPSSPF
jgi:hypothetical protein